MHESILTGSCLCGAVQYQVSGVPIKFYHCHCKLCCKATGTGHASNLLVKPGSIAWIKGETQIRHFAVPEEIRFTNCFCGMCGSRLPRYEEASLIVIPAGSLDSEPMIRPQARIFCDWRTSWSCGGDDLPAYAGGAGAEGHIA